MGRGRTRRGDCAGSGIRGGIVFCAMPLLPALTAKEVIHALERAGFSFIRQKGSHRIYVKGGTGVTIPYHTRDLRKGTLHKIIRQAKLTSEEFLRLLRS